MIDNIEKLIDTNILVYAYNTSEENKHIVAKGIITEIWNKGGGVITLQNLSEFSVVVTKKVEYPCTPWEGQKAYLHVTCYRRRCHF